MQSLRTPSGTEALHYGFDEFPDGGLQPFVIEDTHIQRLMPVIQGNVADAWVGLHTFVGDEGDASGAEKGLLRGRCEGFG